MSTAALLERKHSVMNQYTGSGLSLPDQWPDAGTKFYDIEYTITGSCFTITATPVAAQSADKCGTLSLTHTGAKGASTAVDGNGIAACW
jgi:type IV pilus assembly protein PilE